MGRRWTTQKSGSKIPARIGSSTMDEEQQFRATIETKRCQFKSCFTFSKHITLFSRVHPTCTYVQRVVLPTKQTIRSAGGEIINNYLNFFYLYARPCTHMSSSSSCYQLIFGIGTLCQHFNVSLTSCSYDNIIKNLSKLLKIKT